MRIEDYYKGLNTESSQILLTTLDSYEIHTKTHDLIICINEWYLATQSYKSSEILKNVIESLDYSCIQVLQGIYRGGFSSLRLALEMLFASVYYSSNYLEYIEWVKGGRDVVWSNLIEDNNGIFSPRFCNAFFKELSDDAISFRGESKNLYRQLSEMVHGNSNTWNYESQHLAVDQRLIEKYQDFLSRFSRILNFSLTLRFLKEVDGVELEKLKVHLVDSLQHIDEIRVFIGGPR